MMLRSVFGTLMPVVTILLVGSIAYSQSSNLVPPPDQWPENWQSMEIESKWSVDQPNFTRFMSQMLRGYHALAIQRAFDLEIVPKFGGTPTRMIDIYYDTPEGTIVGSDHGLRLRKMWYIKGGESFYSDMSTFNISNILNVPESDWTFNTDRVQYKSDPTILGATWFRTEVGTDKSDERDWTSAQILSGEATTHPTVVALLNDHPEIKFRDLGEIKRIVDYRSRFEFFRLKNGARIGPPVYEMSLDMQTSIENLIAGGPPEEAFEVEIEILPGDESENMTEENLTRLFQISNYFEEAYGLEASTTSKGGVSLSCKKAIAGSEK